jgi:hypothetical protein
MGHYSHILLMPDVPPTKRPAGLYENFTFALAALAADNNDTKGVKDFEGFICNGATVPFNSAGAAPGAVMATDAVAAVVTGESAAVSVSRAATSSSN